MRSGGEADPVKTNKDPSPYPYGEGDEVVFLEHKKLQILINKFNKKIFDKTHYLNWIY